MRKLQPGDLLEVVGDDPAIREDMPIWCERAGHRLVEMEDEEGQDPFPGGEGAGPPAVPLDSGRPSLLKSLSLGAGPRAQVAQLVEHVTENHGVTGSIPVLGTI